MGKIPGGQYIFNLGNKGLIDISIQPAIAIFDRSCSDQFHMPY